MKNLLRLLLVVASLSLVILPFSAQAELSAVANSTVAVFSDGPTVPIKGFSESLSIQTPAGGVGGAGASKPNFGPAVLLKDLDCFTPNLFLDLLRGAHIQNVTIKFYKTGPDGAPFNYFQIQLSDVQVVSIDLKEKSNGLTLEEVRLAFSKIQWNCLESGAVAGWDLKTNRPLVTSE
jgi:type VI secretion system Hcp family effector